MGSEDVYKRQEKALSILDGFAEMIQVFLKSCRCVKEANNQLMMKMIPLISILDKLFCLRMGNLSKNENNIIFNPTSKPTINNILTKFKINILDSVKELLDFYNNIGKFILNKKKKSIEKKIKNQKINQKFILSLNSIIRLSLHSLVFFLSNPELNMEEIMNDVDLHTLIVEAIRIMKQGSYNCEISNSIDEKKSSLINLVFLPSLVTSQDLLEVMVENPDDFVQRNFFFHSARQKDFNLKMISLKALKVLCHQLDGYLAEVVNLGINCVLVTMGIMTEEQISSENDKKLFRELTQTSYWTKMDTRQKVDSCFLMLSELDMHIQIRPDLIFKLEEFMKLVFTQLSIQCQDNLILTRMILFCGKFSSILFQTQDQVLMDMIKWILGNLPFNDVKGCASELIVFTMMMKENEIKRKGLEGSVRLLLDDPRVSSFIIENLMQRITMNFRPNLIEAFMNLVRTNPKFFEENTPLFEQYFQNLISIVKQISEKIEETQKPLIGNIWFLIKQISEMSNIYLKHRDFIETKVAELFPLINTCLLYTSPSPRDLSTSRMPSSA